MYTYVYIYIYISIYVQTCIYIYLFTYIYIYISYCITVYGHPIMIGDLTKKRGKLNMPAAYSAPKLLLFFNPTWLVVGPPL